MIINLYMYIIHVVWTKEKLKNKKWLGYFFKHKHINLILLLTKKFLIFFAKKLLFKGILFF